MKDRTNVYDASNKDRLLGSMRRWSAVDTYTRFATCSRSMMMGGLSPYLPGQLHYVSNYHGTVRAEDILTVDYVELKREARVSKDGWEAEVIVITTAPLEHLMRIDGFQLPGESDGQKRTSVGTASDVG